MKKTILAFVAIALVGLAGCDERPPSSDKIQAQQQERILQEGTSQAGMPAIKNFRERKLLKMIYEKRDQEGLTTYTYTVAEQTGKAQFLCNSVGYAISDATGYTNPQKLVREFGSGGSLYYAGPMTQAEPNGLYTPDSAEGSWIMCLNPETQQAVPVYSEARLIVSPFKLQ